MSGLVIFSIVNLGQVHLHLIIFKCPELALWNHALNVLLAMDFGQMGPHVVLIACCERATCLWTAFSQVHVLDLDVNSQVLFLVDCVVTQPTPILQFVWLIPW